MAFKKGEFIELNYTGKLKDSGDIFDTTDEKLAKEAHIYAEAADYKPIIICLGEKHILPGIDEFIEGKEPGKYTVEVSPEKGFGKKNADLIKMIPTSKFKDQNIKPVPGLRLNIDGNIGIVKTVGGGRTVIDFNHPLSGRDLTYDIELIKVVTDKKAQVEAIVNVLLGVKNLKVEVKDKKATITFPADLPPQIADPLKKKIDSLTGLDVSFAKEETKEKESKK